MDNDQRDAMDQTLAFQNWIDKFESDLRVFDPFAESRQLKTPQVFPSIPTVIEGINTSFSSLPRRVLFRDVGTVQHIGNGVATLSGLWQTGTNELVIFPNGVRGLVLNLDHDNVDTILLGPDEGINGGDLVLSSGERLKIPVGPKLAGRVINSLGEPLDEYGPLDAEAYQTLDRQAPGIIARSPVNQPLQTGTKFVDALLPIGRGQRELIVGNRGTGKTSLVVDAILNQKGKGVYCCYIAIGQKKSSTLSVIETLRKHGAMEYTTVIVSSPDDPPAMRYLAPFAGTTIAEYLVHELGRDALVVYDDLTKHAEAYRELSLLLRRPPGREAYPGDIFYLHARLLERAGKFRQEKGGASLTALPIVELQRGNISAYIPTNLISITDGQIVLDSDLFNRGIKPAVNVGQSVSRVGGKAQTRIMRAISSDIRLELAQYDEVSRFARFGTDVDSATLKQIRRGQILQSALTQTVHQPLSLAEQILVLFAVTRGYFDHIPARDLASVQENFLETLKMECMDLISDIEHAKGLTEELETEIRTNLEAFFAAQEGETV